MLVGILENCQMGGGELMHRGKVCRTLAEEGREEVLGLAAQK